MQTARKPAHWAIAALIISLMISGCQPKVATPTSAPAAPGNLLAYLTEEYRLSLNWIDNSDNESGFILQRKGLQGGNILDMGRPPTDTTFFIDGSFECASAYEYSISAFNDAGVSETACIQITLPGDCRANRSVMLAPCGTVVEAPIPAATSEAGATAANICGDGTCSGGESATSCPGDCGAVAPPTVQGPICGDGACNGSETGQSCPADCLVIGILPTLNLTTCGNGTCDNGENLLSCPADCPFGLFLPTSSTPYCGDGTCQPNENLQSCPWDCPLTEDDLTPDCPTCG